MTECWCRTCGAQWDIDMEPSPCDCEDGWWSLREDGEWSEPVDRDGNHGFPG